MPLAKLAFAEHLSWPYVILLAPYFWHWLLDLLDLSRPAIDIIFLPTDPTVSIRVCQQSDTYGH